MKKSGCFCAFNLLNRIIFLFCFFLKIAYAQEMAIPSSTMEQELLPQKVTPRHVKLTPQQLFLQKKMNKILQGENLNIGILVQNLKTGEFIYKKNADRYFMPASNQKLFTAFAALHYLGAQFIYQTQLFADLAKIQNGILDDDIYIKFSGDPTLTFSQLDHLIATLSQAGIQKVTGRLIIDDTAFDQISMSPGTSWDDRSFCFGSPVSALILDHNCVSAMVTPAAKANELALVTLPTQPQFMRFENHVMTRESGTDCKVSVKLTDEHTYTLDGCIKITDSPKNIMMAFYNPHHYLQSALTYLLDKNRITVSHGIAFQKIDKPLKLLGTETSKPLAELMTTMLKESDNTIANALFKTMGAFYFQESGSWENGHSATHDILAQSIKLDLPKTTLFDGAGASRYNFLTPEQIALLLYQAYLSPNAALFISALPVSGLDGTLKDRLQSKETLGKVHAKTGSETAVSSLAGYLETRKKHVLAFVILINGFVDSPSKYKQIEDQICTALIED